MIEIRALRKSAMLYNVENPSGAEFTKTVLQYRRKEWDNFHHGFGAWSDWIDVHTVDEIEI